MNATAQLYVLRDPRDGAIRYAGKANDARKRLASHLRGAHRREYPVYRWIKKLALLGMRPLVEVVEETENWREDEVKLIAVLRARGERLLNVADGGDEPACAHQIRRANGAKTAKQRRDDPVAKRVWEVKRHLGGALRKGEVCNATRAKLRKLAALRPDLFGAWAALPDRVEP